MSQITLFFKLQWICFKFAGTTVDDEHINLLLKKSKKLTRSATRGPKRQKIIILAHFHKLSGKQALLPQLCF